MKFNLVEKLVFSAFLVNVVTFAVNSNYLLPVKVAEAKVITYTGVGEYPMGEGETTEMARERAKERAERHALEQAGIEVESETKVINHVVDKDEIRTITRGLLKMIGQPIYTPRVDGDGFMMKAVITVSIETDDVAKWFNRDRKERDNLVTQNKALHEKTLAQEKKITELQHQLATAKTKQDKETVRGEIQAADKSFLSMEKVKAGLTFRQNQDYTTAMACFDEAIALDPDNAEAYVSRGWIYYWGFDHSVVNEPPFNDPEKFLEQQKKSCHLAIQDYTRAIMINPNYIAAYLGRGETYQKLKEFQAAITDFRQVQKIDINYHDIYYYFGNLYNDMGEEDIEGNAESDYRQSISYYTRALNSPKVDNKRKWSAYLGRADTYINMSYFNLALNDYTSAIELYPTYGWAYSCRYALYRYMRNPLAAIDYKKAKELGDEHPEYAFAKFMLLDLEKKMKQQKL